LFGKVWRFIWQTVEPETLTGLKNAKQFAKNCQIARQKVGNLFRQITVKLQLITVLIAMRQTCRIICAELGAWGTG
jgi:hypothetical protein